MTITANVIGASGYTGGELLRLLVGHPDVEIAAATSRQFAGKPLHRNHPHLRGVTDLSYSHHDETEPADVAFLCLPHGRAQQEADRWLALGRTVVDLSADFRLPVAEYQEWYGEEHAAPERVASAVYGLPELTRDRLPGAGLISGVGCNATAINLALLPLARHELIERVICDIKVGSSEAGATATDASHHPERSGATRTYAPAGHRHAGEVSAHLCKNCGRIPLDVTVTAIEMVRGVLCTAHVLPRRELTPPELFRLFREAYDDEPFVRIVRDRVGMHRRPDPRPLAGTNYCDVSFDVDERTGRVVVLSALDNLVKGAAGSAVQSMNVALGLPETAGLGFAGLHPS